jgi:hypothetical protein
LVLIPHIVEALHFCEYITISKGICPAKSIKPITIIRDMGDTIPEFLESRGFTLEQTGEEIEIRIGRRSLAGGLNEIFVGTDEIDSIARLGRMVTISCGKEAIIIKVLNNDQSE